jgi:hypothetical protein
MASNIHWIGEFLSKIYCALGYLSQSLIHYIAMHVFHLTPTLVNITTDCCREEKLQK